MGRLIYVGGGGVVTPPALATNGGATLFSQPNATTTTWLASAGNGFTPLNSDITVRIVFRSNGNPVLPLTVTVCGVAVTVRGSDAGTGGQAGVWLGTARGLAVGVAGDVSIVSNPASSGGIGRIYIRLSNIANWGGTVGTVSAVATHTTANVTGISTVMTLAGAGGLVFGTAAVINAACSPLSVPGWSIVAADLTIGTTAGSSIAAAFVNRTGGAAGSTMTLAASSGVGWTDWCVGEIEVI